MTTKGAQLGYSNTYDARDSVDLDLLDATLLLHLPGHTDAASETEKIVPWQIPLPGRQQLLRLVNKAAGTGTAEG